MDFKDWRWYSYQNSVISCMVLLMIESYMMHLPGIFEEFHVCLIDTIRKLNCEAIATQMNQYRCPKTKEVLITKKLLIIHRV